MDRLDEGIVREEEALLERTLEALAAAARRSAGARADEGLRDTSELRELRDEARSAAEDDLPALLHEMAVRQQLRARRPDAPLPDAAHPYVAHLRVRDERGERDYLLGHASFVDARADVRIVDWRTAPIAQVFYRYREGDEYEEEIAGRELTGRVVARRVLVIENGRLTRILGDGVSLARGADGPWAREDGPTLTSGGAGVAAQGGGLGVGIGAEGRAARADVTALLDAEQHAAIAAPPEQPLLVIGSAGSGKTTVALHRLARIVAREPAKYPLDRVQVIVPEEGLARLSRRLLAPLGVTEAQVHTLDDWALALARRVFGTVPRIGDETPAVVARLKRHPALFDALSARCAKWPAERTRTIRSTQRALSLLMSDRELLGKVVDASAGDLPRGAIEETVRHTMRQLADAPQKELASITDPEARKTVDGREVWESTPEATAGSIDAEDLPIFLWLRSKLAGLGGVPRIAHLVLDEAEDVSLFELAVLRTLLDEPRSVTLAGDDAQQTGTGFAGWARSLEVLGVHAAASTVRLSVSYRCPRPVAELARSVLGDQAPSDAVRAAREGVPVRRDAFPDAAHALLVMASAVRDLAEREPRASIALIASDEEAARRAYEALSDTPRVRLVLEGDFTFEPGIDVTHVDAVKGLEFDYVVLPDVDARAYPDDRESRRRLHVAVTRTTYQLWIVETDPRSPVLVD